MTSRYSDLKRRTRLLIDEALNAVKAGFNDTDHQLRPLELTQLEQRILMSASPAAAAAEMPASDPSPTTSIAIAESDAAPNDWAAQSSAAYGQHTEVQSSVELVVIDPSAENHEQLVADLHEQRDRDFNVVVLNPREDGIAQITDALKSLNDVSAVHLVSHGDEGEILLGTSVLSQRSIDRYAAELLTWQSHLTADADLLIYGCDLTATEEGVRLTESLNTLLGTDVAASNDDTGHTSLGGDWLFETTVGDVTTDVAFSSTLQADWYSVLSVGSTTHSLLLSTSGDVGSPSGAPGLNSWDSGDALDFSGTDLSLGSGTNDGTFSTAFNLDGLVDDGNANLDALHYVTRDITVGGANAVDLRVGDILFSTTADEQLEGNAFTLEREDVGLFRPDVPSDYSSGTFSILLDDLSVKTGLFVGPDVYGLTLVEQTTVVGDVTLNAGDFLYTNLNDFAANDIFLFETTDVGAGTTSGSRSKFLEGNDIGFAVASSFMMGIELVETATTIGGETLAAGTVLLQSNGSFSDVGTTSISTTRNDVVALEFITTEVGSGNSSATASILLRGSDVGLDTNSESINALSLRTNNLSDASTTLTATQDTYLSNNSKNENYGDANVLEFDHGGGGLGNMRSLLQFDLSSLPVGATITGASLQLNATDMTDDADISVYRVTEEWSEGTQNGSNGTANWNERQPGIDWTDRGGTVDSTAIDTFSATGDGLHTWDVTSLVQDWLNGTPNFGLMIASPETGNEKVTYESRESSNAPQLVLSYTVPNAAPVANIGGPYAINEGGVLSLDGGGSSDPDTDPLTYEWDLNYNGTFAADITGTNTTTTATWTALQSAGIVDDGNYTVALRVSDGKGGTDLSTTTLTVNNVAPTGNADTGAAFTTDEATAFSTGDATTNDTDPGGPNDPLTITSVNTTGTSGLVSINADGKSFDYNPNGQFETLAAGSSATDTFTYTLSDSDGGTTSSVLVTITINGLNDRPTDINITNLILPENAVEATIGNLSTVDVDATDTHTYTVSDSRFEVIGNQLKLKSGMSLDFESEQAVTVTVTSTDAGSLTTSKAFVVTVTDVVESSGVTNTVPVTQSTTATTPLTFSTAGGNTITVGDGAADNNIVRTTLSASNGTLTLATTTGLIAASGDGTSTVVVIGSENDINAALDGLTFTSAAGFEGAASVEVTTDLHVNLLGRYDFEDALNLGDDSSPDGANNGTASGGVTSTFDGTRDGNVLSLDGVDDQIRYSNNLFGNSTSVTLSAWVNTNSSNTQEVISIGNSFVLRLEDGGHSAGITGFFKDTATTWQHTTYTPSIVGTGWHHIAYTFDATAGTQTLYLDGVAVNTTAHAGSIDWSGRPDATIGVHENGNSFKYTGLLDDVRIYDRVVTTTELQAITGNADQTVNSVTVNVVADNAVPVVNDESYVLTEGGTVSESVVSDWYNAGWKSRQQIAFDNSAASTDLINHAVLIKLHATDPSAVNIDYAKTQDSGQDLRFVDGDGTLLNHEIELWNESGFSYVWVEVPEIDAGSTADFVWIYYDHDTVPDGQNAASVWEPDDAAVLHSHTTGADSTIYGNDGLSSNVFLANGITAGAGRFNGIDSYSILGSDSTVDDVFDGGGTVSAWINADSFGENGYGRIADKSTTTFGNAGNGNGWAFQVAPNGQLRFEHGFTGGSGEWKTPTSSLTLNSWHHVAVVYDSSRDAHEPLFYVDGVLVTTIQDKAPVGTYRSDAAVNLVIGNFAQATSRTFDGRIDEFRISSSEISADEIVAQVAAANGTFVSGGIVENGPGGLLNNDSDADGDALTATLVSGPSNATSFTLNADGSFHYVHNGSETTSDSFTYSVTDGTSTSVPVTVTLNVDAVNDRPTVSSINDVTSAEDVVIGPISFTVNDAESSEASLTVTAVSSDQSLIPDSGIAIHGSGANRTITLTPANDASGGPATITISVSDGVATTTTSFDVTITAANDAPTIAVIADVITDEDTSVGPISFTISDPDDASNSLTVTATSSNQSLFADADILLGGAGTNRTIVLTPQPNATGGPAIITVRVSDGVSTTTRTFEASITPIDDAPTISAISSLTTQEDVAPVPIAVSISDVDTAFSGLSVNATSDNASLISNDNLAISGTGINRSLTITPTANASGTATVTVSAFDGTTTVQRTFVVNVTPVNDAPTISTIADQTLSEDQASDAVDFVIDDVESGSSSLVVTATSDDQNLIADGSLVLTGTGSNRSLTFTPVANAHGTTTITVTVSDGNQSTTSTFGVTVTSVNDAPTISNLTDVITVEDSPVGPVSFNISDIDTPLFGLTVSAVSSDLTVVTNSDIAITGTGANRTITVTPSDHAFGETTITVSVSDGTTSTVSTFDVQFTPVNDVPEISTIADRLIDEDTDSGPIAFTVNDADHAADSLTVAAVSSNPSLIPNANLILGGSGVNRTLSFTPNANVSGGPTTITLTVSDGVTSTTTSFEVTILPVNDLPTVSPIADITVLEDTSVAAIPLSIADVETAALDLTVTASSSNRSVLSDNGIVITGTGSNRSISLSPNANATGDTTITLSISDGTDTRQESFVLIVTPVNDGPQISAVADLTIDEDTSSGPLAVVVTDVDNANSSLVLTATSSDQSIIDDTDILITGSGRNRQVEFTPVSNAFGGPVEITLTVSDGVATATTSFHVTVISVNDLPQFAGGIQHQYTVADDGSLTVAAPGLLTGVTDAEGDPLSVVLATGPAHGTLILDGDGGFSYLPAPGYNGNDTFTFFVTDGSVNSRDETVSLQVPISVPTIVAAAAATTADSDADSSPTQQAEESGPAETSTGSGAARSSEATTVSAAANFSGMAVSEMADDDDKYVPQVTDDSDDDTSRLQFLFAEVQTDDLTDRLESEFSISTAEVNRVQASQLASEIGSGSGSGSDLTQFLAGKSKAEQSTFLTKSAVDAFAELKGTAHQIDSFKEILEANSGFESIKAEAVKVGSTSLVIGSVIATVRGGMLALGLLSQLPVWTFFDPLMVMDGVGGDEGDSLQDIVDGQGKEHTEEAKR